MANKYDVIDLTDDDIRTIKAGGVETPVEDLPKGQEVAIFFAFNGKVEAGANNRTQAGLVMQTRNGRGTWNVDASFPDRADVTYSTWNTDEDTCTMLTGLVRALKPQNILELGTHRGRATQALKQGVESNGQGRIVTFDLKDWGAVEYFKDSSSVVCVLGESPKDLREMIPYEPGTIDLAFLDASHSYEGVLAELEYMLDYGRQGCVVLVDNFIDTSWPGIADAVAEFCTRHGKACISLPTFVGMAMVQL